MGSKATPHGNALPTTFGTFSPRISGVHVAQKPYVHVLTDIVSVEIMVSTSSTENLVKKATIVYQLCEYIDLLYFAWAHQRLCQCCICHTAPEGGNFVSCDTFYALMHTISYLWHGRECCTQNIALETPPLVLCSAYSTPSHAIAIT